MADQSVPGLGDLLSLFGGSNPLASIGKSVEQWKRGVNEFLNSVETFNATMRTLNDVATRVNRLLDDVEEPIRALMPQVTRTIKATDVMLGQISGPIERVAPGLNRLADTLASPVFSQIPIDIGQFLDTLSDIARRMQPMTQMADTASSFFGLRSLGALRSGSGRPSSYSPTHSAAHAPTHPPALSEPTRHAPPVASRAPAKKTATKTTTAKKSAVKKTAAKKTAVKKTAAKKRAAKKTTAKKTSAKKTSAKKTATTSAAAEGAT